MKSANPVYFRRDTGNGMEVQRRIFRRKSEVARAKTCCDMELRLREKSRKIQAAGEVYRSGAKNNKEEHANPLAPRFDFSLLACAWSYIVKNYRVGLGHRGDML